MLDGIAAARDAGLAPIKLNCVVQRGLNEDGLLDLVDFARREGYSLRCIEYMDVGTTNGWRMADVVSGEEIIERVSKVYPLVADAPDPTAVAKRYRFADGAGDLGVITSVSRPFCGDCTRARLGVDGKLYTCLFATTGIDLREPLRAGATDEELRASSPPAGGAATIDTPSCAAWVSPRASGSRCPTSAADRCRTSRCSCSVPLRERVGVAEIRISGTTVQSVWDELVRLHPAAASTPDRFERHATSTTASGTPPCATETPSRSSRRSPEAAQTESPCESRSPTRRLTSVGDRERRIVGRWRGRDLRGKGARQQRWRRRGAHRLRGVRGDGRSRRCDASARSCMREAGSAPSPSCTGPERWNVGEASVVVVVAAPHRDTAFPSAPRRWR